MFKSRRYVQNVDQILSMYKMEYRDDLSKKVREVIR